LWLKLLVIGIPFFVELFLVHMLLLRFLYTLWLSRGLCVVVTLVLLIFGNVVAYGHMWCELIIMLLYCCAYGGIRKGIDVNVVR